MSVHGSDSEDPASPESESGESGVVTPVGHSLEDAIKGATLHRLQSVLLAMVQRDENRELASELLLAQHPYDASKKRKAYEVCEQCGEEFNTSTNDRESCIYHPEEKEYDADSDLWADHDPDCHGDPESFIDDPDYAEGFLWPCCDRNGDGKGCKMGKHRSEARKRAKAHPEYWFPNGIQGNLPLKTT